MAVQVIKKTCLCPNCRENLQFTRRDCRVVQRERIATRQVKRFQNEDLYYDTEYNKQLVEEWYVICPTCGNRFVGYTAILKHEKMY